MSPLYIPYIWNGRVVKNVNFISFSKQHCLTEFSQKIVSSLNESILATASDQ